MIIGRKLKIKNKTWRFAVRSGTLLFLWACSLVYGNGTITPGEQVVILVVGASGTPEYGEQFRTWAQQWQTACDQSQVNCYTIGLVPQGDANDHDLLKHALHEVAQSPEVSPLWLVLMGHGTYDGRQAKFNLRGPDLDAATLALWLDAVHRPVALIDTASASAPFLVACSDPNRVIITATQSGFEQNVTHLGGALAQSIVDPNADLDKDGQTSLLEAYLMAASKTEEFYQSQGRLLTEHALLDDNGDGLGTPAAWFQGIRPVQKAADDATLDGYRAHQFCLQPSPSERHIPPALRSKRNRLELQVKQLRDNQEQYSEQDYYQQLEALLLQIAHIYETR